MRERIQRELDGRSSSSEDSANESGFDNSLAKRQLNDTIAIAKLKQERNTKNARQLPKIPEKAVILNAQILDDADTTATGRTTSLMDFHRSRYGRTALKNKIKPPATQDSNVSLSAPKVEVTSCLASLATTTLREALDSGRNLSVTFPPQGQVASDKSLTTSTRSSSTAATTKPSVGILSRNDVWRSRSATPTPKLVVDKGVCGEAQRLPPAMANIDCGGSGRVDGGANVPSKSQRPVSADSGRGSSSVMHPCLLTTMEPNASRLPDPFHSDSASFGKQQRRHILRINGKEYQILKLIGKGGSCVVHQVYNEEAQECYAVKCVDLSDTDEMVVKAYKNEISLLEKLQSTNRVVKMFDYEYVDRTQTLYVVMEKGDADLAMFFRSRKNCLSDLTIAFYWSEMLQAVQVVHAQGIVHSDLKPRNFLLVGGHVVLIDFGIANSVPSNKTSITKDCQMGTPNYMSPEALSNFGDPSRLKFKVGVKSDVWSLGVILYNMVYGVTPFHNVPDRCKYLAITNPNCKIEFKPISDELLLDVMKRCLERDPKRRATIQELIEHPYLTHKRARLSASTVRANITKENFTLLAETMSQNTPKSNAKLLQRAFSDLCLQRNIRDDF